MSAQKCPSVFFVTLSKFVVTTSFSAKPRCCQRTESMGKKICNKREREGEGEGVILTFPIDSFHLDGEKERKRKGKIVEMSTGERKVDIKRAGPALKRRKCQFNRIHFK
jgi:hypothetical protein